MTYPGGQLRVTVTTADGAVRCAIRPPAPIPVTPLVRGRTAEEAARQVALIFNVCSGAQEASVRGALGLVPSDALIGRLRFEAIRENLMRLTIGWPSLVGSGGDAAPLRALSQPGQPDLQAVAQAVFGNDGAVPRSWGDFENWIGAGETVAARCFARVAREWDAGWGQVALPAIAIDGPVDWPEATQAGGPVENSPAARHAAHPLLQAIAARKGRGILWRMAGRLVDLKALFDDGEACLFQGEASGIAWAARGWMLTRGALDTATGRVAWLQRLSPTDFALVAGGLMTSALNTLPAEADAPLEAVARLIIETVDPCCPYALSVASDAEGHAEAGGFVHA